jgi:hypothetical protein
MLIQRSANRRPALDDARSTEKSSGSDQVSRKRWLWLAPILSGLLAFYLVMFLRYRSYAIDNAWFASFSYNTFVEHVTSDQFMNVPFPAGMDGTWLFGKLAALTQYAVARLAGWQQWPMEILSASAVTLSLAFWSLKLKKLGYGRNFVVCFVVVTGLSEPFLAAAGSFRYEFLSLLLISSGLLVVAYGRFAAGVFLAAMAFEVEPMAALGVVAAVLLAYSVGKDRGKVTGQVAIGVGAAAAIYLCLHPDALHVRSVLAHVRPTDTRLVGGFFGAYFWQRRRHWAEFAVLALAGWMYWKRRSTIRSHSLAVSAAVLGAISLLAPHANVAYIIFVYPFLVGAALVAFRAEQRAGWILALALAYWLPQYSWLAKVNRGLGYSRQDIRQVSDAIGGASRQLGIADDQLRIYGDYGLWYAHPHLFRAASPGTLPYAEEADLYVCYERSPEHGPLAPERMLYCPDLRERFSLRLISTTLVRGNTLYLYAKR